MIDIVSGCGYPGDGLSNFNAYTFEVDGITCNSMEGFIQSLKFDNPEKQAEICLLIGKEAKYKGKRKKWWRTQTLYWKGKEMNRHGEEYQRLLDMAFESLGNNANFRTVLIDTGIHEIKHSEGKKDPFRTALTEEEFCSRLMNLRKQYTNTGA